MRGLLTRLSRLFDEILPSVGDDVLRRLGVVGDALGIVAPVLATLAVAALALGAMYLSRAQWIRRLPEARVLGRKAIREEPSCELSSRLRGIRRWVKPDNRILSVCISDVKIEIVRAKGGTNTATTTVYWDDVVGWERSGKADWTLYEDGRRVAIEVPRGHGFTDSDLRNIDQRLSVYVGGLEPKTPLQSIQAELREALEIVGRTIRKWLGRPRRK